MSFDILEIDPHISNQKLSNIFGAKYLTFEIILLFCKGILVSDYASTNSLYNSKQKATKTF